MSPSRVIWAVIGLAVILAAISPFAASTPDGLERVAADHGITAAAQPAWNHAPLADYQMPGVTMPGLATALAGILGTLALVTIGWLAGRVLVRKPTR